MRVIDLFDYFHVNKMRTTKDGEFQHLRFRLTVCILVYLLQICNYSWLLIYTCLYLQLKIENLCHGNVSYPGSGIT